jgi:hypothetical protein
MIDSEKTGMELLSQLAGVDLENLKRPEYVAVENMTRGTLINIGTGYSMKTGLSEISITYLDEDGKPQHIALNVEE